MGRASGMVSVQFFDNNVQKKAECLNPDDLKGSKEETPPLQDITRS